MGENSQDNTQNGAPAGGLQKKDKDSLRSRGRGKKTWCICW